MMNIVRPTFIVDKNKAIKNIETILKKIENTKIIFRPHFKTHQSKIIGEWFRSYGVDKITVSSVDMAYYFYQNGWKDITIAFPFNILETDKINSLFDNCILNLLVCDNETVIHLGEKLRREVNIFVELDFGMNRSGILFNNFEKTQNIIEILSKYKHLNFVGFLTHNGETYNLIGKDEIIKNYNKNIEKFYILKKSFGLQIKISIGDTPTISVIDKFDDVIDEIRPGNFIYYDLMQLQIGACTIDEISAYVLAPVVSIDKERNKIVLYSGAIHLSKEFIFIDNRKIYGKIFLIDNNEITYLDCYIVSLSQEHGVVECWDGETLDKINIGDVVGILSVHSCLTADLLKNYTYDTIGNKIEF